MEIVKFFNELLKLMESLKGTPWEIIIPTIIILSLLYSFVKWIAIPAVYGIRRFISWRQKKKFVIHENLSGMPSEDVYYILDHFIPTRYSAHDPARNDEPIPEYMGEEGKQDPLLVRHFLNYEFNQRHGGKFYLCLGDCGMGKTTFLVNLFYATLKKGRPCAFVSLSRKDCLEQIEKVSQKEKTILFLDALDENDMAARDYGKFIEELESRIQDFYRVIITSRTNFFTNAEKEELFHTRSSLSTTEKIPSARKYYIAPFTDEDMQRYLHQRYKGKRYKQAWKIVEENKNLSVRPIMLRYMDDMLKDDIHFSQSYELYEYLFRKWIARESGKDKAAQESLYNECLILAKAMYYQWMKDGRVGIYPDEIDEKNAIPELSKIHFQGHAMLNRTVDGMYKFAHRSYWEYLVARLALLDPVFSDDLFIRNFEQAEAFLKEMISRSDSSESEKRPFDFSSTIEAKLGTANYYLKYWKPEEAEKILLTVLDEDNLSEKQELFAKIHLIRSYRYQWKEASAERILLPLYEILNASELSEELVPYYAQFGEEISVYFKGRRLKKGDLFLRQVLKFCHKLSIYSYDVLRCYEVLCNCVLNPAEKEEMLDEMQKMILEHVGETADEYANFLIALAGMWHTSYKDVKSYECAAEILSKYSKFMCAIFTIIRYGEIAYFVMSLYGEGDNKEFSDFSAAVDMAVEDLAKAFDIVKSIYDDDDDDDDDAYEVEVNNPYFASLSKYVLMYFDIVGASIDRIKEYLESLLNYLHSDHLKGETQVKYCQILSNIDKLDFDERQKYYLEKLDRARTIGCAYYEISALWDLFSLYYRKTEEANCDGQEQLKAAYDIACLDADYRETISYCVMLQVMIDFYHGEINKDALYRELQEITPGIYGKDMRRERIYICLRDYAVKKEDSAAISYAMEVLDCKFVVYYMTECFELCSKYADENRFVEELETLLRRRPEITENEIQVVEAFLSSKGYKKREGTEDGYKKQVQYDSETAQAIWDATMKIKREKDEVRKGFFLLSPKPIRSR